MIIEGVRAVYRTPEPIYPWVAWSSFGCHNLILLHSALGARDVKQSGLGCERGSAEIASSFGASRRHRPLMSDQPQNDTRPRPS